MLRLSLFMFFGMASLNSLAQSTAPIIAYFDKDGRIVSDTSQAAFYRTSEKVGSKFRARDYYKSGQLQMEALCDAVLPRLKWDGVAVIYYESGVKMEEGPFKNEEAYGLHQRWYNTGKPHKILYYKDHRITYHQYWSPQGEALLQNGNGIIVDTDNGKITVTEVKDSLQFSLLTVDSNSDTTYAIAEQMPEYAGGLQKMMSDIQSALKYPKEARKDRTQGRVFIGFIVDQTGHIKDARVIKGIGSGCDEAALFAINSLKPWTPGRHHGKLVKVRYALPVNFVHPASPPSMGNAFAAGTATTIIKLLVGR